MTQYLYYTTCRTTGNAYGMYLHACNVYRYYIQGYFYLVVGEQLYGVL